MAFQAHMEEALRGSDFFSKLGLALCEEIALLCFTFSNREYTARPCWEFFVLFTFCLFFSGCFLVLLPAS